MFLFNFFNHLKVNYNRDTGSQVHQTIYLYIYIYLTVSLAENENVCHINITILLCWTTYAVPSTLYFNVNQIYSYIAYDYIYLFILSLLYTKKIVYNL